MIYDQPLEDRVLVRPIKEEDGQKTDGGIITDTIRKPTFKAEVVAVGPGKYAMETGTFMPTVLAKGDLVRLQSGGNGLNISDDIEKELLLIREGDVLTLISKSTPNN